jgi:hypothetical protein
MAFSIAHSQWLLSEHEGISDHATDCKQWLCSPVVCLVFHATDDFGFYRKLEYGRRLILWALWGHDSWMISYKVMSSWPSSAAFSDSLLYISGDDKQHYNKEAPSWLLCIITTTADIYHVAYTYSIQTYSYVIFLQGSHPTLYIMTAVTLVTANQPVIILPIALLCATLYHQAEVRS